MAGSGESVSAPLKPENVEFAPTIQEALTTISGHYRDRKEPPLEEALRDPQVNLHVGCWYLQSLLTRYRGKPDPLTVALASYNAGPSNVEKWASEGALAAHLAAPHMADHRARSRDLVRDVVIRVSREI